MKAARARHPEQPPAPDPQPASPATGSDAQNVPSPRVGVEWRRKHLLSIEELTSEDILLIFGTADGLKEVSTRSVKDMLATAIAGREFRA